MNTSLQRDTRALAEAMFSDESGAPPPERIDWLCEDFEDFVEQAGMRAGVILRSALWLATWAAPLGMGKRPPLRRLSLPDRVEALVKLEESPAGLPLLALKAVVCMIYFEHPDAQASIGVDMDCLSDRLGGLNDD